MGWRLSPLENACPRHGAPRTGQTNPLGKAWSVPASSPAAALPFPPWSSSLPSFHRRFPGSQRTPNPKPLPPGVGGAGSAPAAPARLPGRGELPADVRSSALGSKTGSPRLSGPAGTRPHRALPQSWVTPEGRGVPGEVWQVLVPVSWGFLALAELESHPEGWIPSIPKNSMASHALEEGACKPHPKLALEATPSIPLAPRVTEEGHPCRDPAPRNLREQGAKQESSSRGPAQFPFILAGDCHGNRCHRDDAAQHPTAHRDTGDEATFLGVNRPPAQQEGV